MLNGHAHAPLLRRDRPPVRYRVPPGSQPITNRALTRVSSRSRSGRRCQAPPRLCTQWTTRGTLTPPTPRRSQPCHLRRTQAAKSSPRPAGCTCASSTSISRMVCHRRAARSPIWSAARVARPAWWDGGTLAGDWFRRGSEPLRDASSRNALVSASPQMCLLSSRRVQRERSHSSLRGYVLPMVVQSRRRPQPQARRQGETPTWPLVQCCRWIHSQYGAGTMPYPTSNTAASGST